VERVANQPCNRQPYCFRPKQNQAATVTKSTIAQLFGVDNIYVSSAVQNTAKYPNETNAFILGNHAFLAYVPPSVGVRTPMAGVNFVWDHFGPSRMTSYPWWKTRSTHVELEGSFGYSLVSADLGGFFYNAIA
jgi:hypothetical protein